MVEILPGIYRLQLPLPPPHTSLGYVNSYLVQGNSGCLLVDTGWNTDQAFSSLQKQLAETGVSLKDISQIVVTHIHPDHYGLAGRIKQLTKAKFSLHYLEKDMIESRYVNMEKPLRQTNDWLHVNGVPSDELPNLRPASVGTAGFAATVYPDVILHGGETISTGVFTLQVLWTPGHSPGHISLYEPTKKILISGDHILPTITPHIGFNSQSGDNPLGDYLHSLSELTQLDVEVILPGHEKPFTALQERIKQIIQHHEQRNSDILAIIKAGPKTAYQTAREIDWQGRSVWQNLPPLHKRMAIFETLSHLKLMKMESRVTTLSMNSIIYYQQT